MASLWFEEMWEMSVSSVLVRQLEKQKGEKKVLDTERAQQAIAHKYIELKYIEHRYTDTQLHRTQIENKCAPGLKMQMSMDQPVERQESCKPRPISDLTIDTI